MVTKTVDTGTRDNMSCIIFWTRSKTTDTRQTHTMVNTPHNQVPCIFNTRPRLLIVYQPMPLYSAPCIQASQPASQPRTTYIHKPPEPHLVEKESLYFFLSTDFYLFKINVIKPNPHVFCCLQPYACL